MITPPAPWPTAPMVEAGSRVLDEHRSTRPTVNLTNATLAHLVFAAMWDARPQLEDGEE